MEFPKHIVAVVGLINNEENKILMMLNHLRGWELPGGQVEMGEDLIIALQREVAEETGINISTGQLMGVDSNLQVENEYIPTKVIFSFLGEKVSGELKTSNESLEVKWVSRNEVLNMITHPIIYDRTKEMLCFSGKIIYRAYTKNPYEIHRKCFI